VFVSPSRPVRRVVFAAAALALAAGAYAMGRGGRSDGPGDAGKESAPTVPTPPPAAATPERPAVTPARTGRIRDGGSVYFARFAGQEDAPTTIDGTLLTERKDECVDACPVGLRIVVAPNAASRVRTLVTSLGADIEDLAEAASAEQPEFAAALRAARASYETWGDPSPEGRPRRLMSIAVPRPDYGDKASLVAFAAYDHCDPVFDANRAEGCPTGGGHLLIARAERREGRRAEVLSGYVEVEVKPTGTEPTPQFAMSPGAAPVVRLVAPIFSHFSRVRGRVHGLFLAEDGSVHATGPDLTPKPLRDDDDRIAHALTTLLGRA
jgi:hypothetical protein